MQEKSKDIRRLERLISESILAQQLGYFEIAQELRSRALELEKKLKETQSQT